MHSATHSKPLLLLQGAQVFAPGPLGTQDLLIGGGRILGLGPGLEVPRGLVEVVDARGLLAVPGFIDGHVHLQGAGGEGGFHTRTPELMLGEALAAGVTSVVGCLGTDHLTRSLAGLLAKARALEAEGLSTWILTGAYAVPPPTLTGSVEQDLLLIDKVIGVGEVAISDPRSTQPTLEALARVAAEALRGGLLAGKAGVVNLHLGDGKVGLDPLFHLLDTTDLPPRLFWPTHINRNPRLFEQGLAYARKGGVVDFTTSTVPAFLEAGEVACAVGLKRMLEAGIAPEQITFTSDGQGSLPAFDGQGCRCGLAVGRMASLHEALRASVREQGVPLEVALQVVTTTPASVLRLPGKGRLAEGFDADLLLLAPDSLEIHTVVARGRRMVSEGRALAKGTYELG